jgi:hypothetical protein
LNKIIVIQNIKFNNNYWQKKSQKKKNKLGKAKASILNYFKKYKNRNGTENGSHNVHNHGERALRKRPTIKKDQREWNGSGRVGF